MHTTLNCHMPEGPFLQDQDSFKGAAYNPDYSGVWQYDKAVKHLYLCVYARDESYHVKLFVVQCVVVV